MDSLAWLAQHRLESVEHPGFEWIFAFDNGASVEISCLWRLLENDRIRFTIRDEGQQFGLPTPVDAAEELNRRIANAKVESVILREYTLDFELRFDTGHALQVFPDSSGYEAWGARNRDKRFIAVGGGELAIFGDDATSE